MNEINRNMKTKYIITDPCYLLSSNEWFNLFHDLCTEAWRNELNSRIEFALEKLTGSKSWVAETGYGDWSNVIIGECFDERHDFYADSGTVCVCKFIPEFKKRHITNWAAAIIEADGEITVEMDTSNPHWTIVRIEDSKGNKWRSADDD